MKRQQISLGFLTLFILVFGACGGKDSSKPATDSGLGAAGKEAPSDTEEAGRSNGSTGGNAAKTGDAGKTGDPADATTEKCGNGKIDPPEECDDGNDTEDDGCTLCTYDCKDDNKCEKEKSTCSASLTCDLTRHVCVPGEIKETDGTKCNENGVCRSGKCITVKCGNNVVDPGEECDDGNKVDGDGCTNRCKYTCLATDPTRGCATDCNPTLKCDDKHTCSGGATLADGTSCQDGKGKCQAGKCVNTSDAGTTATDPNDIQPGGVCERMSTIQCAGEAKCCTTPKIAFATEEECKTNMKKLCTDTLRIDQISVESVIGFDAAFAKTAFTEFDAMAQKCDPNIVVWGSSQNGLRGILKGTVKAGGDCTPMVSLQLEKYGAALFACADGANYSCLPRAQGAWTCEKPTGAGTMCFTDVNCTTGLYCDNPEGLPGKGTCKERKDNGSTCAALNECTSLACQKGKCVVNDTQTAFCLRPQ